MRVLFTTQPGDGHLNPLVPLAHALTAAGHEVAVACAPSFCPTVEARNIRAFPMGLDWSITDSFIERWLYLRDVPPHEYVYTVLSDIFAGVIVEHALPDLVAIAHAWSPDIIVRETNEFAGWLAAETRGLPHASVEVTLFAFYLGGAAAVADGLSRQLTKAGLLTNDVPTRLFAHLHLSFVPPSLEDPAAPLPATAHSLRSALLDPAPGEQVPPWLADLPDRPTIYATLGTVNNPSDVFGAIIAGVRDLDVNLIVTLGRNLDPAQFGPQPDNVHIMRYLSQVLLLSRCNVVVNHGGFSTVLGALTSGVPMVILPGGADAPVNARRTAALGVAIVLGTNEGTPEAFRAAVQDSVG